MNDKRVRQMRRASGIASAIIGVVGIWTLVYLSFFVPGMFLVIIAILVFLVSRGILHEKEPGSTRSIWVFDREGKGKWEDIDRVIRR